MTIYRDAISPTVQNAGIEINRTDDPFSSVAMEDIWKQINTADFIIVDVTGRNPNVYYALGIAHTLGKPVILLTQNIDDVPFELRDKRAIKYGLQNDAVELEIVGSST